MTIQEVERKKVATQWDGGWFCDKCECLVHWKTKAYMFGKQCLCHSCAEEKIKKMNKTP